MQPEPFARLREKRSDRGQRDSASVKLAVVDELAVVEVVPTEPQAELLCGLLRSAGIQCTYRLTNQGAGAFEGIPGGGPQEILVRTDDLESARTVLDRGDG
jgi:hypothetical protein